MNAGEKGNELAEFVCQEILDCQNEMSQRIMVSTVVQMLVDRGLYNRPSKRVAPAKLSAMSGMQVRVFSKSIVPKWQYKGRRVGDVPLSYLLHLTDPDPWLEDVWRYLASAECQREMELLEDPT